MREVTGVYVRGPDDWQKIWTKKPELPSQHYLDSLAESISGCLVDQDDYVEMVIGDLKEMQLWDSIEFCDWLTKHRFRMKAGRKYVRIYRAE